MGKKRVLLIWWELDHRPEYLQPFIDMSGSFEFIQLIYKNREERTTNSSPFQMAYWHDYKNARSVLKHLDPQVIIGVTESIFSAALINSARKAGIPFYGLQHGFTHESISSITVDTRKFSFSFISSYIKSSLFFIRSFSLFNVGKFCSALYFYWMYPRMVVHKLLTEHYFPWLVPDHYICFSPYSAEHYKQLYRLKDGQVKYIGILWFDKLFQNFAALKVEKPGPSKKYYLLIDTCFDNFHKPISKDQVNRCYRELHRFCEENNAVLKIKLHPWNYNSPHLLQHPGIAYIQKLADEDLYAMIAGSEGCFGFYSTLLLPVLAIKPLVQIDYGGVYLSQAKEMGLTPVIDFFTFTAADIHFPVSNAAMLNKNDLDYLLYKTDGHAQNRLKEILLSA